MNTIWTEKVADGLEEGEEEEEEEEERKLRFEASV